MGVKVVVVVPEEEEEAMVANWMRMRESIF